MAVARPATGGRGFGRAIREDRLKPCLPWAGRSLDPGPAQGCLGLPSLPMKSVHLFCRPLALLFTSFAIAAVPVQAQAPQKAEGRAVMSFEDYNPVSMLKVPGQEITRAKFPFIDVHNHQ